MLANPKLAGHVVPGKVAALLLALLAPRGAGSHADGAAPHGLEHPPVTIRTHPPAGRLAWSAALAGWLWRPRRHLGPPVPGGARGHRRRQRGALPLHRRQHAPALGARVAGLRGARTPRAGLDPHLARCASIHTRTHARARTHTMSSLHARARTHANTHTHQGRQA